MSETGELGHGTDMGDDEIVAEVRRAREALLAACGDDLDLLAERLRREQRDSGHRVVSRPPRAPEGESGEAA